MEERLQRLEEQVTNLRVSNRELAVNVDNLSQQVRDLAAAVTKLNTTISESKGALWVVRIIFGGVGAGIAWFLDHMKS